MSIETLESSLNTCVAQPGSTRLKVSEALVRRFNRSGPRYTSYPTADRFADDFGQEAYISQLQGRAATLKSPPLSLYFHLPFCESLCYFCACNKIVTQDRSRSAEYLDYLIREIEMVSMHLGSDRLARQLHLGGGTPTFLSNEEMALLMRTVRAHFHFSDDAEISVEIDPRTVSADTLSHLAELGFNRTSFGVQDFDPKVQEAIHRVQPLAMVQNAIDKSRALGFESVNTDLIYGLPKQSLGSFSLTLDTLIGLRPDRIALYNYAHLPQRFKAQRLIREDDLPDAETRLQIFLMSTERLLQAGYEYIGLDHFALPGDELNLARLDKSLHRNFQGYTTRSDSDLLGFGVSAIGKVGTTHVQNVRSLKEYCQCIDRHTLPTSRGFEMSPDDSLRQEIIMSLMCAMPVPMARLGSKYNIDFRDYFSAELNELGPFADADLVRTDEHSIQITESGRLFVRAISMIFDKYLQQRSTATYSRLI
ncbi:oxygen-independent coproporphyrinogen III oxidase [Paenalcaligenes niemegkensis]|uniref:oxygen-independent coproporphyrinogen III oxidase n=1 Tax=Paenalcaligenes niemegkensis TaxID=2895469 RepID=UPI001EE7A119|nr:oxygen-independent coproporphyrinogen III oxidase [Paenalcaligenes niemegkensis]MCQ9616134.1 oxygen-independent coproporphyrinogen III oxidase [Paenalcaligenes niemegkensis]